MKIIFHPSFDNGYYTAPKNSCAKILGTKIIGTAGLLEHLELHNGFSGIYASDGERAAAYLSHVRESAQGTMIETSFKNDELGVAKCLLEWRDKLIMAGWTPERAGDSTTPKLNLLSKIEESWKGQMKGIADRWLELSQSGNLKTATEGEIDCRCAKEQLPLLIQKVLEMCGAKFAKYEESMSIPDDLKVKVEHYTDLSDAYRQLASHAEEFNAETAIINRDDVSLNHILFAWGKPLVNATIRESNPFSLQLFKLAMAVFSRPLNIENILAYLQLPIGPVPRRLRSKLANILIQDGGFGSIDWDRLDEEKIQELKKEDISSKWDMAIYDYINEAFDEEKEEEKDTKVKRASKASLLKYITDPNIKKGDNIPTKTLMEYIGAINQWASAFANSDKVEDEMLKRQMATVVSYFKQLSSTLKNIDTISYQDLEKHVRTIYKPMTIIQARAQVGSLKTIDSYTQLLDMPKALLWLDCCGVDETIDPYEFLSTTERNWLNNQPGIVIPRLHDTLEMNRKEMISILSRVKDDITLVTADYHHNPKMAEHPIVAELKMQRGKGLMIEEKEVKLELTDAKKLHKVEPKLQYKLGKTDYAGRKESNTSLDTLINYPFDYVVEYVARLGKSSKKELGSLKTITGLVAHSFIASLIDSVTGMDKEKCLDEMEKLLNAEYEPRLENAIYTTGLSLLLKENDVEYDNIHYLLKRSTQTLITIMREKKLTPIGCELAYNNPLENIGDFDARIDMVLEDSNGKTVIFDFKWTYSEFYGKKIEEGKSIQLELYRKELEEKETVSAVGYYLMPKCQLQTSDYDTLKDENGRIIIQHIDAPQDAQLFKQIKNSYNQRMNEIRAGEIEEGEEMDIKDLPYAKAYLEGENKLLLVGKQKITGGPTKKEPERPYCTESIQKESKKVFTNMPESRFRSKTGGYENNNVPMNEKPTTYPLMKGRLK